MQPTNIIYEIASKPIGELAELPAAELAEMQKEVETLIALADNVRKWLNGALMLKYRDRLDAKRRELGRTFGEIRLQEDGLEITEDRPMVLEWQKEHPLSWAKGDVLKPQQVVERMYEITKGEAIITVDHLTKEFKLPRKKEMFKAVDDVSFSVKRGSTLAIVGESGSGKSTVANMVLKLLEPTSGTVTYEGKDISGFKGKELLDFRRHVQPVFQNPYGSLDPMYSIYRSIEEPLRIHGIGDKKSRVKRVRELLDMVELPESVMGRYPNELSGGQRQRIAIARAMALDPDVIVCDEAVSALDVLVQDQVLRLLNDLQAEKGLSYLFITHDLAVVRQIADEVVVMQHGKLVEHATTDEVFDHPQKQYTRDLLDAIPGGKLQLGLD